MGCGSRAAWALLAAPPAGIAPVLLLEMNSIIPAPLGWRKKSLLYTVGQQAAEVRSEPNSAEVVPAAFTARAAWLLLRLPSVSSQLPKRSVFFWKSVA